MHLVTINCQIVEPEQIIREAVAQVEVIFRERLSAHKVPVVIHG